MTDTKHLEVVIVSLPNADNDKVERAKKDLREAFGEDVRVVVIANEAIVSIIRTKDSD